MEVMACLRLGKRRWFIAGLHLAQDEKCQVTVTAMVSGRLSVFRYRGYIIRL